VHQKMIASVRFIILVVFASMTFAARTYRTMPFVAIPPIFATPRHLHTVAEMDAQLRSTAVWCYFLDDIAARLYPANTALIDRERLSRPYRIAMLANKLIH